MTAAVWKGGRLPFSASLGDMIRKSLAKIENFPETHFLNEILQLQEKISHVPKENEVLIEITKSREGWHLFLFSFEGRSIHQGLAYLLASRLSQNNRATFKMSVNDYGLELLSREPFDETLINPQLFSFDGLEPEITALVNMHELARSQFRDIARIAGLIFQGYPGRQKSHRQLQVSSSLLYEVFSKYDPENLLAKQARSEVLQHQFDFDHLKEVLDRLKNSKVYITHTKRFSPFALPLFIERVSGHLTTETLSERIEKIKKSWTKA